MAEGISLDRTAGGIEVQLNLPFIVVLAYLVCVCDFAFTCFRLEFLILASLERQIAHCEVQLQINSGVRNVARHDAENLNIAGGETPLIAAIAGVSSIIARVLEREPLVIKVKVVAADLEVVDGIFSSAFDSGRGGVPCIHYVVRGVVRQLPIAAIVAALLFASGGSAIVEGSRALGVAAAVLTVPVQIAPAVAGALAVSLCILRNIGVPTVLRIDGLALFSTHILVIVPQDGSVLGVSACSTVSVTGRLRRQVQVKLDISHRQGQALKALR